jgi:predicted ArsR family transcriptional regulator
MSLKEKIIGILKDKDASASQIAKDVNANKRWVDEAMKELEKEGCIKYHGGRLWQYIK